MEDVLEKICYHCHVVKPILEFNKCKTGMCGYHNHCRDCQKKVRRNWYLKNREKELEKASQYAKSEKAKLERKKRWEKQKHILGPKNNMARQTDSARARARKQRNKWNSIPQNRIAINLRSRLRAALKGVAKSNQTERLIGCSFFELKQYLESKFQPGMTWENYGKWHIDHIKPCASFDLTNLDQQNLCFHYTNLQPLWAKDNISKSNKII